MSSRDLQAVVKTQKAFIKELLDRLENSSNKSFSDITDAFIAQKVRECIKDGYFNNLSIEQIFELAKKSIRLTKDNCDMTHKLEDLLEKAKINGDNYYVNELKKVLVAEDF